MEIILGIGEYAISDNKDDILKTFSLGSCVALTVYSIKKKVLAMAHIALPSSEINIEHSKLKPGHYADTAIPLLLNTMINRYNCSKHELITNIYGGAYSPKQRDYFKIGERNVNTIKDILAKNFIYLFSEETGGAYSRNVEADVATGTIKLGKMCLKEMKRIS